MLFSVESEEESAEQEEQDDVTGEDRVTSIVYIQYMDLPNIVCGQKCLMECAQIRFKLE